MWKVFSRLRRHSLTCVCVCVPVLYGWTGRVDHRCVTHRCNTAKSVTQPYRQPPEHTDTQPQKFLDNNFSKVRACATLKCGGKLFGNQISDLFLALLFEQGLRFRNENRGLPRPSLEGTLLQLTPVLAPHTTSFPKLASPLPEYGFKI